MAEKKIVEALIGGGQATAGPPLGPSLGPLGLNVLAVVKKINELTKDYAGMKVPVTIEVDVETRDFDVTVGIPTASALIVKELGIEKGSGTAKLEKVGDLTMEQLIHVTKVKRDQLFSKTLTNAVKEILGTCVSMGITVDGKEAREVQEAIDKGYYDELLQE